MRAGNAQPSPVSQAIRRAEGSQFREIWAALASVDGVHFDGALPPISVARGPSTQGEDGGFTPAGRELFVADSAPHPRAAFLHELGHALDWFGIGTPNTFASPLDQQMAGWRAAVLQSQRFAEWDDLQRASRDPALRAFLPYHFRAWELWARSYAQYIATRSSDSATLAFLQSNCAPLPTGTVLMYQWERIDFEPIARAIDTLFQRQGWIQ
jgi:hypothetical protein